MKYLLFIPVGIVLLVGLAYLTFNSEPELELGVELKAPKDKVLVSKEIDWIVKHEDGTLEDKGKIIKYDYISDKEVPVDVDEDISRRTGNAKFYKRDILGADSAQVWEGRFYGGTPFVKEGGKWYQTETATISISTFNEEMQPTLLDRLLKRAYAACGTSGDPCYSGAGDGHLGYNEGGSWQTFRDAATSNAVSYTGTTEYGPSSMSNPLIFRLSLPFDTRALPDGAIISSSTIHIYGHSYYNDNDNQDIVLIGHTRGDTSILVAADYSITNFGSTELATRFDLSNWAVNGGENSFLLNANGRSHIEVATTTIFGFLISSDYDDIPPTGTDEAASEIRASEYAGTANDPYLAIEFTEGGAGEERHIQNPITY